MLTLTLRIGQGKNVSQKLA